MPGHSDSKHALQRQRQSRYEARLREGVALYPAPLGAVEIGTLIDLGWPPEGSESDRRRVGEALAAAVSAIWLLALELNSF
jgi:hypothetical protein